MIYKKVLRPLFFTLGPELIHEIVMGGACLGEKCKPLLWGLKKVCKPQLSDLSPKEYQLFDKNLPHPIGLAAGFLKNAEALDFFEALGFSFLEIGSVTARPSLGNPKPRIWRLKEDRGLINKMGLNNKGIDFVLDSLLKRKKLPLLGLNIAKTHDPLIMGEKAIEDMVYSFSKVYAQEILDRNLLSYVALNVSCPNTREGKTFEDLGAFQELMSEIKKITLHKKTPYLIKLSPDLSLENLKQLVGASLNYNVQGFIAGNTLKTPKGGLSGAPLKENSTKLIKNIRGILKEKDREDLPIIGVGGIETKEDVKEKLEAGANLLQIYTGFIYEGPRIISKLLNV